ncbi:CDP-diacylglycerol--glycerol-3-phosphate 3-phosphatidyltransferase [Mycoplasmopsis edwardii]|uniref:CDP-diacylglycerol--glycerol-3-phosphate 3-phosphatidyltransferase n=1 Tax=Mycoplasmopsis edwardii TaxID=53558 RepID=UPI001CB77845|nr:CDP-diacylglycerol--glycerol-3-phosphate 3-phosphatidyltransferase [Mycoplasmopsis edwardii]
MNKIKSFFNRLSEKTSNFMTKVKVFFQSNRSNIPNWLTILRMILIAPALLLMIFYWVFRYAFNPYEFMPVSKTIISLILIIFIISMVTDFLDGYLARRWKVVSNFGKLWDPLADKVMTTSVLIFLASINVVPFWIVVIFVLRDIIIDGIRVVMYKNNVEIAANIYGKIKTLVMSIGIILSTIIYLSVPGIFANPGFNILINITMVVALGLSLYSGYLYIKKAREFIF